MSGITEYLLLCREVNLPRKWQAADAYAVEFHDHVFYVHENDLDPSDWLYVGRRYWLPREGDLLTLIEAEGEIYKITLYPADDRGYSARAESWPDDARVSSDRGFAYGSDRCIALLRLLLVVREGK